MAATEFLSLPDELILKVFRYLTPHELNLAQLTCRQFRKIAQLEILWQWYCWRDFKANDDHLWDGWTYRDFYTKALFRHSYLFGIWQRELKHYGGLFFVKMEKDGFIGYEILPPLDDFFRTIPKLNSYILVPETSDYSQEGCHRLRCNRIFAVMPASSSSSSKMIQRYQYHQTYMASSDDFHGGWVTTASVKKTGTGFRFHSPGTILVSQLRKNPSYWFKREYGFRLNSASDYDSVKKKISANFLHRRKRKAHASSENLYEYVRVTLQFNTPKSIAELCVKPGLYSGTYIAHGWEILKISYSADAKILEGTKITGDPNVPSGKISVRVFLTKPIFFNAADLISFDSINEAIERSRSHWTDNVDASKTANIGRQQFLIPEYCDCERPESEIPKYCRWFYMAEGQVAENGYEYPEFIPCVFVGFDDDFFGIIFLGLQSLGFYYRANNCESIGLC